MTKGQVEPAAGLGTRLAIKPLTEGIWPQKPRKNAKGRQIVGGSAGHPLRRNAEFRSNFEAIPFLRLFVSIAAGTLLSPSLATSLRTC